MRVALITACYGAYDPVRSLPAWHGFDDAVCVTDDPSVVGDGWRVHVEPRDEHPRLAAKRPKMMPWLFTDCDAAVWIDASFEIIGRDFRNWSDKHLAFADFIVWRHPENRIDFVDEAQVCMDWPKYRDYDIRAQVNAYVADGMPRNWGLFACGAIAYRFSPVVKKLCSRWYDENVKWSVQDQVSLPYLLWDSGMAFGQWGAYQYKNDYLRLRWDERPNPQA